MTKYNDRGGCSHLQVDGVSVLSILSVKWQGIWRSFQLHIAERIIHNCTRYISLSLRFSNVFTLNIANWLVICWLLCSQFPWISIMFPVLNWVSHSDIEENHIFCKYLSMVTRQYEKLTPNPLHRFSILTILSILRRKILNI